MGDLDAAWRSVRDVLGEAAKDAATASAAGPARIAHVADDAVATLGHGDAADRSVISSAVSLSGETADITKSSAYRPGRDLIDEADYTALRQSNTSTVAGADPTMVRIQAEQGFNGLPTRVTPDVIDAAVAAGEKELFRGFEQESHVEDFLNKPPRPGGGTTGIGTYATPLREVALRYTNPARRLDGARESQMLRMALRPGARTIKLRDLESEHTRAMSQLRRDLGAVRYIANRTNEEEARYIALQNKELTISDVGRYAALRGYDAIDGSNRWKNQEWLILNHTALLVQR
ncbi:hypothetical protein [Nocardia vaccinii]|uniref:hypothetical protein n=1 Tax=Nocardia vaccinii TaxID=1822 RepID=UPI000830F52C|nr:hypothetical protein [Nocardia vaccinii]